MKPKRKLKKILISTISLVLVAGIGLGAWYYFGHKSSDPVFVYEFGYIGMTEYWGDSQESYGPVSTSNIQTIYLSDTQTVTEILVSPGDTVQKGDVLMTFDTTLSDLALERKRLDVEKLKLQLEDAKDYLYEINSMKPMVIPEPSDPPAEPEDVNLGTALTGPYQISTQTAFDGSSQELALICWLSDTTAIEDSIFDAIRAKAEEYQAKNALTQKPTDPPAPASEETSVPVDDESSIPPMDEESSAPITNEDSSAPITEESSSTNQESSVPTDEESSTPVVSPDPIVPVVDQFYVIFKVTEGNMSLAAATTWQGMLVNYDVQTQSYRFQFFDANGITDHMIPPMDTPEPELPEIDFGSGFTAAQIAEMRAEQEKTIKDLEFSIKMAEADYKIMQTEVSDGNVYAEIDGTVVSLLSEEEAKMTMQPLMKVSGGGGFYIDCSASELTKDELQIGQEVTVNDWNTGMVYTGVIDSLGDYPVNDGSFNGMGNPNVSYYPFTVFIDETADLQAGSYVSVMYDTGAAESGVYLENPFLRTEQGKSYVYVRGEDGLLEKRFVTTGRSLWGNYTEILRGLTAEDYVAFPYGKTVKAGAPTVEGDMSDLYDY